MDQCEIHDEEANLICLDCLERLLCI